MNVTVFSTTTCAICHAEMQWLDKQGVKYNNVVIDEVDDGMEQLMTATGGVFQTTPFTLVETEEGVTEKVAGFDRPKLVKLLNLS